MLRLCCACASRSSACACSSAARAARTLAAALCALRDDVAIVEPRDDLARLHARAFGDAEPLEAAGRLRRDRRLALRDDVAGRIQHDELLRRIRRDDRRRLHGRHPRLQREPPARRGDRQEERAPARSTCGAAAARRARRCGRCAAWRDRGRRCRALRGKNSADGAARNGSYRAAMRERRGAPAGRTARQPPSAGVGSGIGRASPRAARNARQRDDSRPRADARDADPLVAA